MRWLFIALATLAVFLPRARGQAGGVAVDLMLDEKTYLPGEEIPVGVRVSNLSGRPLTFGETQTWLAFYAEAKDGDIVARFGAVPVEGAFTLDSAKAGTKWWNIQPYFDFSESGIYRVYAEVRLPDWNERVMSEAVSFTLQPARKMWETTFGVPPAPGQSDQRPEVRRYALQSAVRTRDRNLYVRVTDESESHIFRVLLLDRLLSFSNPEQQLDNLSRLHVLFQTGGSTYTYCVVTPDGDLAVRQRHEIQSGTRPKLSKLADGTISVRGGHRLPAPSDIPPEEPAALPVVGLTNAPAVTNNAASTPTKESRSKRKSRKSASATPQETP